MVSVASKSVTKEEGYKHSCSPNLIDCMLLSLPHSNALNPPYWLVPYFLFIVAPGVLPLLLHLARLIVPFQGGDAADP